ncbi:MAG: hypothetical protein IPK55_11385 [Streptococcus sp.]|nr:hypothetical protein [Streptococcus sp.]
MIENTLKMNQRELLKSIHLTEDFLIIVDKNGRLKYFLADENTMVSEFRPENPIEKVFLITQEQNVYVLIILDAAISIIHLTIQLL